MKNCPECNSQKIIKDVKVLDRGRDSLGSYDMQISVDEKPDALVFKSRGYSDVEAEVCADCGYIAFYAKDLYTLLESYQNRQNKI